MSLQPTVSVVIPTYNRSHCISDAIRSVLVQESPANEIIVVDDGSTDNTAGVLARWGDQILVIHQRNSGAGAARNTGMRNAGGDWVAFLDSDDIWYPNRLAALRRDLRRSTRNDIVGHTGNLRLLGAGYEADVFSMRGWSFPFGSALTVECPIEETLTGINTPVTAVRRDAALAAGGFREDRRIFEDAPLFCELALKGPWLFSGDVLGVARRLPQDEAALSRIAERSPLEALEALEARSAYVLAMTQREDVPEEHRAAIRRRASGVLFELAAAQAAAGSSGARNTLWQSVKHHPSPARGILRALPALLFGCVGFNIVLSRYKRFSRG